MNENLLKYLTEKETEFFGRPEVLPEDPVETFNPKIIKVKKIPDNSDSTLNADEFMYSNSKIQSYYARGNGIKITDNQDFYEAIKAIKDLTDKHLFLANMTWKADIKGKRAIVKFSVGKKNERESNEFFLQSIQQYLMLNLHKTFGNLYDVSMETLKEPDGRMTMLMIIKKNKDEERKEMKMMRAPNLNTDLLSPKSSSISQM